MRYRLALVAALLCSANSAAQQPRLVRSSGPGAWGSVRLVEDLRIGLLEGEDPYTFGLIQGIAAGPDGSIWVVEYRPARIRIYDSNGRFVRNVGREGEGPGEYRQIIAVQPMPHGGIAILDGRVGRITVYDATGDLLTSHRFPISFFTSDMLVVDSAGNFYVKTSPRPATPGVFTLEREMTWIKVNSSGNVVDTIPIPHGQAAREQTYGGPYSARTPSLLAALSPFGYFVTGNPARYSFDIHTPGAALRVEREYKPVSLSRGERAEWNTMADYLSKEPIGMSMRIVNGRPDTLKGPTIRYNVPKAKPAYRAISVGEDGAIWIERYVAAEQRPRSPRPPGSTRPELRWYEPHTFDLFEPTGRFLGTLTPPSKVTFEARRGMAVYGILVGEFDEQYVVRYRIERSQR